MYSRCCVSRSYPGFCSFGVGKLCEACFPTVSRRTVCLSKRMQKKKCPLTPRGVADISVCDISMPCLFFLVSYVLFVFRKFALSEMGETVMFIVLAEVETHFFALNAYTHGNELVYEPISEVAHSESIGYDDCHGKKHYREPQA